jgi:hypothetical protein
VWRRGGSLGEWVSREGAKGLWGEWEGLWGEEGRRVGSGKGAAGCGSRRTPAVWACRARELEPCGG